MISDQTLLMMLNNVMTKMIMTNVKSIMDSHSLLSFIYIDPHFETSFVLMYMLLVITFATIFVRTTTMKWNKARGIYITH